MASAHEVICSPRADFRLEKARAWLDVNADGREILVVAPSLEAADDLIRETAASRGALFAIHRLTLNRLAGLLAAENLARFGKVPASGLSAEAVAARALFRLKDSERLSYFGPVVQRPGFASALTRTIAELRLNEISADEVEGLGGAGPALAALMRQFQAELDEANLVDRAEVLRVATKAALSDVPPRFVGIPALLFDVAAETVGERNFVAGLAARAPMVLATVPFGDEHTQTMLAGALCAEAKGENGTGPANGADTAIARLQNHLFADTAPPKRELDDTVALFSGAGEMQECVEIARRIQAEAGRGVPFDQMAVLLHAPGRYAPYLEEALSRASVPAYFARGASRPEPGGRALLALLACAGEKLSARRFAEYLSLAQVPDRREDGVGGAPKARIAEFVRPDPELALGPLRADNEVQSPPLETEAPGTDPVPVVEGTLRAPWRWERLLVDAAVIGSRDRWKRRLAGLEAEVSLKRSELSDDDTRVAMLDRQLVDLQHLKEVAISQIDALAALPIEASWGEWLRHLRGLVEIGIRDREPVMAALAELEPMAPVGPVGLDEVRTVLADRLGRLEARPVCRRYGAVFVAPTYYARGLSFDITIVPGLSERTFPRRLTEDPILPDSSRRRLSDYLPSEGRRSAAERMALRLAVGAARRRVIFSYPRVDLDQGRPRVPSFYALEILRAAEGRLPGFDEFARRASGGQTPRMGWPAPPDPNDAIDEAEFDLAVLESLVGADPDATTGAAHYLLGANEHLARALRTRARRWLRRWTPADGLVDPKPAELAALARHQPGARSYSPTALQNFAACPYRFFLQAIHRLEPREESEAIEVIDPLTRGALFHEVQFEVLSALKERHALPVTRETLSAALGVLNETLEQVTDRYREELAPAIERVWRDGIESIRRDLHEWLRRAAQDPDRWRPEHFELAFGLSDRAQSDPASAARAVSLDGGLTLRGSIDLVEQNPAGRLRVTDHKTGRVRAEKQFVIGGGKILQPVLYGLAAERVLGKPVESGRLYYCTAAGNYEERIVALDEAAHAAAGELAAVIGGALSEGFLPAAPDRDECRFCDYRRVCGPYEEIRTALKPAARLSALKRLREMP
jgi:ATP-dependent helicase/nuclease subunit B